ncbi:hypothetical protein PV11_07723 [Exophiala sideris]|uniref:Uncharacterized protein n=1 Tax=Exophiala sideris TaxID=1016849 RepID=A0A0D1YGS9_9EURO|nr:hypothetical protein PV11_07723 [Exophiala sideris]
MTSRSPRTRRERRERIVGHREEEGEVDREDGDEEVVVDVVGDAAGDSRGLWFCWKPRFGCACASRRAVVRATYRRAEDTCAAGVKHAPIADHQSRQQLVDLGLRRFAAAGKSLIKRSAHAWMQKQLCDDMTRHRWRLREGAMLQASGLCMEGSNSAGPPVTRQRPNDGSRCVPVDKAPREPLLLNCMQDDYQRSYSRNHQCCLKDEYRPCVPYDFPAVVPAWGMPRPRPCSVSLSL